MEDKEIQLSRFRVREGKEEKAKEWMEYLRNHLPAALETLEDENMYVETIFSEWVDGRFFLYWYSIQGRDGKPVEQSDHELDKVHISYWKECIDNEYGEASLQRELVLIPNKVQRSMK
ncbi:MAG: DUF6176 family protein [Tissierellia bacterium]|nr:DUF6176 family protein [Tissierellia bacterium]